MEKNPDQIGTIFVNEGVGKGAGQKFFGGRLIKELPSVEGDSITVELIYFESAGKNDPEKIFRGFNVIKLA